MPLMIVDHHLKDFDTWIKVFMENPPPPIGKWRLLRGTEDPNRVYVIGEYSESEAAEVEAFVASDKMKATFAEVDAVSTQPLEFVRLSEVKPG